MNQFLSASNTIFLCNCKHSGLKVLSNICLASGRILPTKLSAGMLDAGQLLTFPVRRQYRHITHLTLIQFTACIVHEPPSSLWPGYLHINFSTHEIFSSLTWSALHKNMHSGIFHFCFVVISYWQILPVSRFMHAVYFLSLLPLQNCLIYHLQIYSMKIRNTCIS